MLNFYKQVFAIAGQKAWSKEQLAVLKLRYDVSKRIHRAKFKPLILRALSALKLFLHGKTNLTPFEANHGREANTVLQN